MSKAMDRTGDKYGLLTVVKLHKRTKRGGSLWLCECECGNLTVVRYDHLARGRVKSCGCLREKGHRSKQLVVREGDRHGRVKVVGRAANDKHGNAMWDCECVCGTKLVVKASRLASGRVKSCGCIPWKKKPPSTPKSLVGSRFGHLLVTEKLGIDRQGEQGYVALCDCGREVEVNEKGLTDGLIVDCGNCDRKPSKAQTLGMSGIGFNDAFRRVKLWYKREAERKGVGFDLPDILLFLTMQAPCRYCGKINSRVSPASSHQLAFPHNGVHLADESLGYVRDNLVTWCSECEKEMSGYEGDDFLTKDEERMVRDSISRQQSEGYVKTVYNRFVEDGYKLYGMFAEDLGKRLRNHPDYSHVTHPTLAMFRDVMRDQKNAYEGRRLESIEGDLLLSPNSEQSL